MNPELKRFAQAVRRQVRLYVREHREPPPLTLYVPTLGDARRPMFTPVGAAEDANGVRANIREGLELTRAQMCAIGRGLVVPVEGLAEGERHLPTTAFGLMVITALDTAAWSATIEAGTVGAWVGPELGVDLGADWWFVQQAMRTIAKEDAEP